VNYVELTIDGDKESHDARRTTKGGGGTFDVILTNLKTAIEHSYNFEIGVRCNVDRRNRDSVTRLIGFLKSNGILNKLHKFYPAIVHSWGNDAGDLSPSTEEFAAWEIEWLLELVASGFQKISLVPARNRILCMVFKPQSELVDAHGSLFNCSEVSYVPTYETNTSSHQLVQLNTIPKSGRNKNVFGIGDVESGVDESRRQTLASFYNDLPNGKFPCGQCAILPICGGSCPKLWIEGITPCPPEKFNIGHRLVIEYLLSQNLLDSFEIVQASTSLP
jgi:uncharacterized protein